VGGVPNVEVTLLRHGSGDIGLTPVLNHRDKLNHHESADNFPPCEIKVSHTNKL